MPQGKIKKLVGDRGFGFIETEAGGGKDLFFHHSAVTSGHFDDLSPGQKVEYTLGQGDKGPRAENVTVVG